MPICPAPEQRTFQSRAVCLGPNEIVVTAKRLDHGSGNLALGFSRGEQFQDELDCETGTTDHRLAGQDLGIDDDALR